METGHLDATGGRILRKGFEFLSSLETMQRLLEEKSANTVSRDPAEANYLAQFLGFESGGALLQRYLSETNQIRKIYEKIFSN